MDPKNPEERWTTHDVEPLRVIHGIVLESAKKGEDVRVLVGDDDKDYRVSILTRHHPPNIIMAIAHRDLPVGQYVELRR